DSWVSENTGQQFGPGFAYESSLGSGGANSPNDPGDNWGDGNNGCANIGTTSPPVSFCWTITVKSCENGENFTGNSLNMIATPYSDGESGDWNQSGCNSGATFDVLATVICCEDPDPEITEAVNETCPDACDGSATIMGGGDGPWNFNVFDTDNNIVFNSAADPGPITATDLCAGTYSVIAENVITGCSRSNFFDIGTDPRPIAEPSSNSPVCPGGIIELYGSTPSEGTTFEYHWTGPGGYESFEQNPNDATEEGVYDLVVIVDGCESDPVGVNVTIYDPIVDAGDDIDICIGQGTELMASGGDTYIWEPGNLSGGVVFVEPTETTTYTVTSTDANDCVATDEVIVVVHELPDPELDPEVSICNGDFAIISASNGIDYIWDTGEPDQTIIVNPETTTTYTVTVTDEWGCEGTDMVEVIISEPPVPDIQATEIVVCPGGSTTITATAVNANSYSWSTGGSGQTITVSPTETTTYIVTVTDYNSCENTGEITIFFEEPLSSPIISCGPSSPTSVEFNWADVPSASGYNVTVLTGQTGIQSGTTFTVGGLSAGEAVTIQVEAVNQSDCPNSMAEFTCYALDCPEIDITISSVNAICLDSTSSAFNLTVNLTGNDGTGTGFWSGAGITDSLNGTFNPVVAGGGMHQVAYNFLENNCLYVDSIAIVIGETPTATFNVTPTVICNDSSILVTYTGNAPTNATYTWNFDGGAATPGTGQGPHTVSWTAGGEKTISLQVELDNCTSGLVTQAVQVDQPLNDPVISCVNTTTTSVQFCWDEIAGAVDYTVNVVSGHIGVLDGTCFIVQALSPGESVTIEVIANGAGACGNSSSQMTCIASTCPDVNVDISDPPVICSDDGILTLEVSVIGGDAGGVGLWSGPSIVDPIVGTFDPSQGDTLNQVIFTWTQDGCIYVDSLIVPIFDPPSATFVVTSPICISESATITYVGDASSNANYTWNFNGGLAVPATGPGPIEVTWASSGNKEISLQVEENGCASEIYLQTVEVEDPLPPPVLNCNTTTQSITFTWNDIPGAVGYNVIHLSGATGVQNGNSYEVTGLSPGDEVSIQVEAIGDGACGNITSEILSCIALDCSEVTIDIDAVPDICLNDVNTQVNLIATLTGGNGGGTGAWNGDGIVDGNIGTFDAVIAGAASHTITYTYTEGNCVYNQTTIITVYEAPTATFSVDEVICETASSTVSYTGSGSSGATFTWDFDGGTAVPGTGSGPHEVSWSSSGAYNISLTVEENGCVSETIINSVQVDAELVPPTINCSSTNTSVEFSWPEVQGATDYSVDVLLGQTGAPSSATSYLVNGLEPGDEVTIEVTIIGDTECGNISVEQTCVAQECPDVVLTIDPVEDQCANGEVITLLASQTGGMGGGSYQWSGTGIADVTNGLFDPAQADEGDHLITVVYQEGVCSYTENITITVFPVPSADFTVTGPVCTGGASTVTYMGAAAPTANYSWNFDGGTATPGTGAGSHEVNWTTAGIKTITLSVEENGCESLVESQQVIVEEPMGVPEVSCETTSTSIEFSWQEITGAEGYEVNVLTGQSGTLNGTTYLLTGLLPQEEVTVEVIALNSGPCGNSNVEASCIASDCTPLQASLNGPAAICQGDVAILTISINGGSDGPFDVILSDGGQEFTFMGISDGYEASLNPDVTTTYSIVSVTDASLTACVYTPVASHTITVNTPMNPGNALPPVQVCAGTDTLVQLSDLLAGADASGQWQETSAIPSIGGGFNAALGTLDCAGQPAGIYTFRYLLTGAAPCEDAESEVSVILDASPIADAGEDQELTCLVGMVTIGGTNTSEGAFVKHEWESNNGVSIQDSTSTYTEVSQAGVYTLHVQDESTGCGASDDVVVTAKLDVPVADVVIGEISCFQSNDGVIEIASVSGGEPPYEYSLNGITFTNQNQFAYLGPENYIVTVRDANGCLTELFV
ncbi:MAG: hypothetical protein GY751_26515, partial [Bacteroidetes bacterium]|nr:hypothetical protein [Bacteroidota bacterium]